MVLEAALLEEDPQIIHFHKAEPSFWHHHIKNFTEKVILFGSVNFLV
jgi:hypothetical protein